MSLRFKTNPSAELGTHWPCIERTAIAWKWSCLEDLDLLHCLVADICRVVAIRLGFNRLHVFTIHAPSSDYKTVYFQSSGSLGLTPLVCTREANMVHALKT